MTSVISVARPVISEGGKYRVIDGMHRTEAVRRLIADSQLPADFAFPCVEFSADTPEDVAVAYAQRINAHALRTFACLP